MLRSRPPIDADVKAHPSAAVSRSALTQAYDCAMAVVALRGVLATLAGGRGEQELQGETVGELLRELERRHPAVKGWILDERHRIRRHVNVFVNGERGDEATRLRVGDRIDVIPAITGG